VKPITRRITPPRHTSSNRPAKWLPRIAPYAASSGASRGASPASTRELTRFLASAYQLNATADYGIGPTVAPISADQAAAAIATARRFIDAINQLLSPGSTPPRGPNTQP
jgi:hypothetical protein